MKNAVNYNGLSLVSFLLGIVTIFVTSMVTAEAITGNDIYAHDSKPYGLSYGDWSAKWWQWAYSIPAKNNPVNDDTGEKCSAGQNDTNVWFLAGTSGGTAARSCKIPAGKAILFPIINVECDYVSDKSLKSESDFRQCAKNDQDKVTNLRANVDGFDIPDLKSYRVQSPLFNLTLPKDNIPGLPEGVTKAVSDGYWIILKPLPVGTHNIHFSGTIPDFTATGPLNFVSDANYNITIAD